MLIDVEFACTSGTFDIDLFADDMEMSSTFEAISVIHDIAKSDPYTGSYTITPTVDGQRMETAGKTMTDDVEIRAIPYYAVDNALGGQTIVIGDDLFYGSQ